MATPGAVVRTSRGLEGWAVTAAVVGTLALGSAVLVAAVPDAETGLRAVIRTTGRVSIVLFCAAFLASSLVRLRRSAATVWLRRNRRYVGVSFAGSHAIHLIAIVALVRASPEFRSGLATVTLVVGGLAYVFIFAMAATSFDAAVRRLGAWWHRLHLVGAWYVWAVFTITELPDGPIQVVPALLTGVLLAVPVIRYAARRLRPARESSAA